MQGRAGEVRWLLTGREGGVSSGPFASLNLATHVGDDPTHVARNRARVAGLAGVPVERLGVLTASHSDIVSVVDAAHPEPADGADAVLTTEAGLAVAALAADCALVLLFDADAGVVGAVHAGWLGARDDVVGAAVGRMRDLGARDLHAVLGPSICGGCYPVPPDRAAAVAEVLPEAACSSRDGQPALDLRRGLAAHLRRLGATVEDAGVCTAESLDHFSYRRDGVTGRQAAVIWREQR